MRYHQVQGFIESYCLYRDLSIDPSIVINRDLSIVIDRDLSIVSYRELSWSIYRDLSIVIYLSWSIYLSIFVIYRGIFPSRVMASSSGCISSVIQRR